MLLKFMLKRYIQILHSNLKIHGFFSRPFLFWLLCVPPYLAFNHIALQLDNIFYRKYKDVELQNILFIMAHPRSGTTLLHRTIVESGNYLAFRYWEMLFPALVTRRLIKAIVHFMVRIRKDTFLPKSAGHHTKLQSYEEEDILLVQILDTSFIDLYSSLMYDDAHNFPIHDLQEHRFESMKFLKNCFKRQAYYYGKNRLVTKMNFSILRIETLSEFFPDARFIYIVRDPIDTIPSHLTMCEKIYEHIYNSPLRPDYYNSRKQMLVEKQYKFHLLFYIHFYNSIKKGSLDNSRILELFYNDLVNHFEQIMDEIDRFAFLNFSDEDRKRIQTLARQQQTYKRPHDVHPISSFGITPERIRNDLDFLYNERFTDRSLE